jgi:hypothetical protein
MKRTLFIFSLVLLLLSACTTAQPEPTAAYTHPSPSAKDDPSPTSRSTGIEKTENSAEKISTDPTESIETAPTASVLDPKDGSPEIDGMISPAEWESARAETFADGSELWVLQTKDSLYLGIRSSTPEMIAGNVFIQQDDEIKILHTSAALGTAIYQKYGEVWQQIQNFSWCCRGVGNNERLKAERAAFLDQEGWVAANSRTGTPNELEYQIDLTGETIQLAINILRSSNPSEKIPFPVGLDDDCIKPTPGGYPTEMFFSPEKWMWVSMQP